MTTNYDSSAGTEQNLADRVAQAKISRSTEDTLIQDYLPFIRSEASRFLGRTLMDNDDELSIALIAFHEAIHNYDEEKGTFLSLASLTIKSRLTDYFRKEKRHMGHVSMNTPVGDTDTEMGDLIISEEDSPADRIITRDATRQEIAELAAQMADFGVSLSDVADNCPKQERNKAICLRAMQYARENTDILDEFLCTKRLPLAKLSEGSRTVRKTLERHRKYLIALLLICTNGYEIIRGHLKQVLKGGVTI